MHQLKHILYAEITIYSQIYILYTICVCMM